MAHRLATQHGPTTDRLFRRYVAPDLLILDDFALHRLSAQQSEDLSDLIIERHRHASFALTSNRGVHEWLGLFDNPILGNSALDRLANAAHQLVIEEPSYRAKLVPKHRGVDQPGRAPGLGRSRDLRVPPREVTQLRVWPPQPDGQPPRKKTLLDGMWMRADMSKLTVTRIFWGRLIAIAGGLIVLAIATGLGVAGTGLSMSGPDVVGVQPTSTTWVAASMSLLAILALIGGALGQLVAWIGALLNTAQLEDKVWFLVLLLLGIFGLGFIPMLVYVLPGPDGTPSVAPARQPPTELPKAA